MGTKLWGVVLGVMLGALLPSLATADQWNDRTVLKFSEPVMIPGATLQPGTYVFKIADSAATRHMVQVFTEDQQRLITTTHAVPTKRPEAKGDVVLKFNPTDVGTPPALKAWFYPGSLYGHEFVYPEQQARQIAERTKTVVLSTDVPGTDKEQGTLYTYDPSGKRGAWQGDAATMREWDAWQRNRPRASESAVAHQKRGEASAPMIRGDFQGTRVKIDDLEDNPTKYIGQTVSVDAKVEEVFGPRLFTIDEPNWGDLQGEMLVFMKSDLAALVKEDDRVTITGNVQRFVRAEVEREWGWLGLDPEIEVEFSRKPILVAERIVGGNNDMAMVIDARAGTERAVGTSGSGAAASPISDVAAVRDIDNVGQRIELKNLRVSGTASDGGFFVQSGDRHLFVLPAQPGQAAVRVGQTVQISGVILQMPDEMDDRLKAPGELNDEVYLYATTIAS